MNSQLLLIRCVALLGTGGCLGATLAAPPQVPLRISSTSDFVMHSDEIRLEGVVTGVSLRRSAFGLRVSAVTPIGARREVLAGGWNTNILFEGDSLIVMRHEATRGLGLDELGRGSRVVVVTPASTMRQTALPARLVAVESLVPGPGARWDIGASVWTTLPLPGGASVGIPPGWTRDSGSLFQSPGRELSFDVSGAPATGGTLAQRANAWSGPPQRGVKVSRRKITLDGEPALKLTRTLAANKQVVVLTDHAGQAFTFTWAAPSGADSDDPTIQAMTDSVRWGR